MAGLLVGLLACKGVALMKCVLPYAVLLMFCAIGRGADKAADRFQPGVSTRKDLKPYYFSIPAPRGQILDRRGQSLAQNSTVAYLQLTVPVAQQESLEAYAAWIHAELGRVEAASALRFTLTDDDISRHYKDRHMLPIEVGKAGEETAALPSAHLSRRVVYVRLYPHDTLAAHTLGYVAADGPALSGPVVPNEPLWQRTRGATGLEDAFNQQLTGSDGRLCLMISDGGVIEHKQVFISPVAGSDVVTTLNLETQQAAEQALDASKRRGAVVIVDASTGDIRALASNPRFAPGAFAQGISSADFEALSKDVDGPLFDRANQGSYPPGSVFKPFVLLAGLRVRAYDELSEFECGPTLMIDGREFDNWSKDDYGWFNARAALVRSCNTYFYQAAMLTRDAPILAMARAFGFGEAPVLPLRATAGILPQYAPSNHDLANLSIGQGVTEASPMQVALAMTTLANGACRPRPRLVMQVQRPDRSTSDVMVPARLSLLPVAEAELEAVKNGMFGVVNHARGTGKAARLDKVAVYGKTGTAQWVLRGEKANVVWFAGFVDTTPPLAFVVTLEGNQGEGGLSGSGTAAPVIAKVLRDIESHPEKHGVTFKPRDVVRESDPLLMERSPAPFATMGRSPGRRPDPPASVGDFFSRIFR